MPKVILMGDIGTEQEGYRSSTVIEGSTTVAINDRKVARVGDSLEPYTDGNHTPHQRRITTGSSSVFIDGKPVALEGSKADDGGVLLSSQITVIIG